MAEFEAKVAAVENLAPNVVQVTISVGSGFRFAPGQYVSLRLSEGLARAYCIASAPERPEALQICVRLGSGKGSGVMRNLKVGDSLALDGPFGDFIIPEDDQRPAVFIGGDTGIAPIRSIVLHMLATDDRRPITVLYDPDGPNVLYAGDFDPLAKAGRIAFESGPVETVVKRHHKALVDSILMVAGFEPFLGRAQAALNRAGVAWDHAIVETFGRL